MISFVSERVKKHEVMAAFITNSVMCGKKGPSTAKNEVDLDMAVGL